MDWIIWLGFSPIILGTVVVVGIFAYCIISDYIRKKQGKQTYY